MKIYKSFLSIIAVVAIVAVAGWNLSQNLNKGEVILSDVALANVEALADGENGTHGYPTTVTKTTYTYSDDGRLLETSSYSYPCCAPGDYNCSAGGSCS